MASAALHAQAVPAPMEVTAHESATIWTQGYGVGNGRLGALSYGEFPKEILVLNEESIFAKSSIVPREGAAEGLKEAREWCARGDYKKADETFRRKVLSNKSSSGSYQQGGPAGRPVAGPPPFHFFLQKAGHETREGPNGRPFCGTGQLKTELVAAPYADCIAYRMTCTLPKGCTVTLSLRHPDKKSVITPARDGWILQGQGHNGGIPL